MDMEITCRSPIDPMGKPVIYIHRLPSNIKIQYINPVIYNLLSQCDVVIINYEDYVINLLPDNIIHITLNSNAYYKNYKPLTKYPKKLKSLRINSHIFEYYNSLPNSLETLTIFSIDKQKIMPKYISNLPLSLKNLLIMNTIYQFNIIYPEGLQHLDITLTNLEQLYNLPNSLNTLIINLSYFNVKDISHPDDYKHFEALVNNLPDNITHLSITDIPLFGYLYNYRNNYISLTSNINITKLPNKLEYLFIKNCNYKMFENYQFSINNIHISEIENNSNMQNILNSYIKKLNPDMKINSDDEYTIKYKEPFYPNI